MYQCLLQFWGRAAIGDLDSSEWEKYILVHALLCLERVESSLWECDLVICPSVAHVRRVGWSSY